MCILYVNIGAQMPTNRKMENNQDVCLVCFNHCCDKKIKLIVYLDLIESCLYVLL